MSHKHSRMKLWVSVAFACGLLTALALETTLSLRGGDGHVERSDKGARGGGDILGAALSLCAREARADLDAGEYEFFPNRRSIWIVNRSNGRMAMYHFRDDELGSVDRSRVATIDLRAFPREDTEVRLSDRNLNNILWVCNRRTGDVQMWAPTRDGVLKPENPVTSSNDLVERRPAGN